MGYLGYKPADKPLTSADITDGIITSAKIVDGTIVNADINASAAIAGSKLSGAGISQADQWRLTAQASGDQSPISANLERVDTDGFGYIGTGMTQSSGIFTFPTTGVYLIKFQTHFAKNGDFRAGDTAIETTTDNSTYSYASYGQSFIQQTESNFANVSGSTEFIFNVSNVTTHKCRFSVSFTQASSSFTQGDTVGNATYMTFIRLGDSV
jgi:hypothetical protein